ncbi:MAG TPA: EipA family protein [Pseudolabrys sp.]|nr:EipA family protein [Pseudolabrys sp.]
MRAVLRLALLSGLLAVPVLPVAAQYNPPPAGAPYNPPPAGQQYSPPPPQYNSRGGAPYNPPPPRHDQRTFSSDELIREGHRFFGTVSRGLAEIVEKAVSQWGQPNGYVLGQEGSGAFVVGLRYGDGKLYTKNAGDRRVFWEGPSVGFDAGGEGARTMMLIYNLPATDAIYQRFVGIDGSAYFIGGFGMTALASGHVIVVPIRSGVGLRLGANVGYLKFTSRATWNPF